MSEQPFHHEEATPLDPFEQMTHDDFLEALQPQNWEEVYQRLHTPTFEAVLQEGQLALLFPDGQRRQFERSDVEALTRFLDQYAGVEPLPVVEDPFPEGWQATSVDDSDEQEHPDNDTTWIHRQADLAASFQWQEAGTPASVDYTTVLGKIPNPEGDVPLYVVHVQGTADSGHGYTYPIEAHLIIKEQAEGAYVVDDATEEQIALVTQDEKRPVNPLDVFPVADLDPDGETPGPHSPESPNYDVFDANL